MVLIQTARLIKFMKIKTPIILLFTVLSISNSFGLEYRVFVQCGDWVESRKQVLGTASDWQKLVVETGVLAFLSGWQARSNKDVFKGTSNESIFLWMDNYCQKNPLSNTYDGAMILDYELDGIELKREMELSNKARIGMNKK